MSEVINLRKNENVIYYKPNVGALTGKVGKSIIETIMNTPKPDRSKLHSEAEKCRTAMAADMHHD